MVTRAEYAENRAKYVRIRQRAQSAAIRDISEEHPEEVEEEKARLRAEGESIKNYSTKARRNVAVRYRASLSMMRAIYFEHFAKEEGYVPLPGLRGKRDGNNQKFVSPYEEEGSE